MRVCATVVTHNRKALLAECLEAILAQTSPVERVYVIDNASTDGTRELLAERGLLAREEIVLLRLDRNAGSSGGFARGIAAAREDDCDWIWVMDDDAEPRADALERLLASPAAEDPSTAVLCSAVVSPSGAVQPLHRGHIRGRPRALPLSAYGARAPTLGFATWVGMLIRTEAARAIDPPREDFFIWADDYEYSYRLLTQGSIRLVADSVIVHKDEGFGGAYTNRRSRWWNRLFGWDFEPTPYSGAWRNLCGIRNWVWIKRHYEGESVAGFLGTTAQFVLKALLYDERPLRRIPWLIRFAVEGRRGVFRNISPQEWGARAGGGATRLP